MKQIVGILLLTAFVSTTVFGQAKKNRFGLKGEMSLNWMKPENEKKYQNDGAIVRAGYGLTIEFGLGDGGNAALVTGFGVNSDGGKLAFRQSDSIRYFTVADEFVQAEDSGGADRYKIVSRTYRNQYVTLPVLLKMKTNEIGAMTYFFNFGFLPAFNFRADVDDEVVDALSNEIKNEDLDNERDIQFLNMSLVIGGGAEINLSGSTSFVFGINVMPGFMNVVKKNSRFLIENGEAVEQKASSMNIGLTAGFLF